MDAAPTQPICPYNNFGRGMQYVLDNADPAAVEWYEEQWRIWEDANPEDPTGEKAWKEYEYQITVWNKANPAIDPSDMPVFSEESGRVSKAQSNLFRIEAAKRGKKKYYRLYLSELQYTRLKRICEMKAMKISPTIDRMIKKFNDDNSPNAG